MLNKTSIAVALVLATASSAFADESGSRHTFRRIDAGTAEQLASPRKLATDARIIRAQPLAGTRPSSSASGSTSTLSGARSAAAVAPVIPAVALRPAATHATQASIVRNVPLIAATADDDAQPQIDDRAAVDNNARLARSYSSYAPATVSYNEAQLALGAHRVQTVAYGNTYGTYSPAAYHGRFRYSYVPRTYYYPSYPAYYPRTSYYVPQYSSYYSSGYCPPVHTYHTYHAPSYRHHHSHSWHRPSYRSYHHHGHRRHCGSSFGFSISW